MRKWALALLTTSVVGGCTTLQPSGNAVDRIKPYAAECAGRLALDDMQAAREACYPALSLLGRYAGW
jgi:hypothetical protein